MEQINNQFDKASHDDDNDPIPIQDLLYLSPIDKYRIYGRFPLRMFIQFILILTTSMQAMVVINDASAYCRSQLRVFYDKFISDSEKESPDFPRINYIYTIEDLRAHLKESVLNYFTFKENSLEKVQYESNATEVNYALMEIDYYNKSIDNQKDSDDSFPIKFKFSYNITPNYLGPFDSNYTEEDIKIYLSYVEKFTVYYALSTYVPFYYKEHLECFGWRISHIYDFSQRGHFEVSLSIHRTFCSDNTKLNYIQIVFGRFLWVHFLVIIFSACSLFLTWQNIYIISKFYWKQKHDNILIDRTKVKVSFNKWNYITLIGNIFQFISGIIGLIDKENMNASTDVLVGFGCMFAYFNIGKYLSYYIKYSIIYATLYRALPNVIRFLIGVLPIFIGFVFFGVSIFWRSERFLNTSNTIMSLFSMINGDSIYDIISDVTGVSFFLGQIYSYSFCLMFIVVVINVFIAIIEEAYVSCKMRNQNHWIYRYLKGDPNFKVVGKGEKECNEVTDIANLTQGEIKEEMNKRMNKVEERIENCKELLKEVERMKEGERKEKLKEFLRGKLEEIEKGMERMNERWEQRES